jgi:hypothetical protein
VTFEILDRAFVLFSFVPRAERAKIAALAGLEIYFFGVQAVLARFHFADHAAPPNSLDAMRLPPV